MRAAEVIVGIDASPESRFALHWGGRGGPAGATPGSRSSTPCARTGRTPR